MINSYRYIDYYIAWHHFTFCSAKILPHIVSIDKICIYKPKTATVHHAVMKKDTIKQNMSYRSNIFL